VTHAHTPHKEFWLDGQNGWAVGSLPQTRY
jgi:hypothetical protein